MKRIIIGSFIIFMSTLVSCDSGRTSNTTDGTNAVPGTTNPDTQQAANGQPAAGVGYDSATSGNVGGGSTGSTDTRNGSRADNTGSGITTGGSTTAGAAATGNAGTGSRKQGNR